MKNKLRIAEFLLELDAAQELDAGFAALARLVEDLGFSGLVYTSIPTIKPLRDVPPIFLRSDGFSQPFLHHYEQAGFARDDFTIRRIASGNIQEMDWWEEERRGRLSARERTVISTAREEYRIRNGLSIPTLAESSQIAGASIVSDEKDPQFHLLLKERFATLRLAVRHFHFHAHSNHTFRRHFFRHLLDTLTDTDRAVLRYAASGLPLKAYKDAFGVSPRVVANQRTNLFRKLRVRSIDETMYFAGVLHLLEEL